jgi:GTPase
LEPTQIDAAAAPESPSFQSGFVTIVGKPNVGKSTLINALLGQKLCITTPKAQTTRHRILGIRNAPNSQMIFVDTPGVISPKYELQKRMMSTVEAAITDTDVILLMAAPDERYPTDLLEKLMQKATAPIILVMNKSDLTPLEEITPAIHAIKDVLPLKEAVIISAMMRSNLDLLLERIHAYLPQSPPFFDTDQLTDRPERFFVAEIIREKIYLHTEQEVPYACEVQILQYTTHEKIIHIEVEIHVDRQSQKGILIGQKGRMLNIIGREARMEIQELLGSKVFLNLYVRVTEGWKQEQKILDRFGYEIEK